MHAATVVPLSSVSLPVPSSPFVARLPATLYVGSTYAGQMSLTYFTGLINLTWRINPYVTCDPALLEFTADTMVANFSLTVVSAPDTTEMTQFNITASGYLSGYTELTSMTFSVGLYVFAAPSVSSCSSGQSSDGHLELNSTSSVAAFANNASLSNMLDLSTSSWSFGVWVRRTYNSSDVGRAQAIFSIGDGSAGRIAVGFTLVDAFTVLMGSHSATISQQFTYDTWEHWCATYDYFYQVMRVYKNGAIQLSSGMSHITTGATSGAIIVGTYAISSETAMSAYLLQGSIDDLRVWRRELTDAEILTGFKSGSWEDYGLALDYSFATPAATDDPLVIRDRS